MSRSRGFGRGEYVVVLIAALLLPAASGAAVFPVKNTNDSGAESLRQAILDANATAGHDTIVFAIPGVGVHTIMPLSALPELTDGLGLTLDGYTQAGAAPNNSSQGTNAVLQIEIAAPPGPLSGAGLVLGSSANIVRGLAITRFSSRGIWIREGSDNLVAGCFVGVSPAGIASPNGVGVLLSPPILAAGTPPDGLKSGAASDISQNRIGDGTLAGRNLISGNSSVGIAVDSSSENFILGNLVGTDASGDAALPNSNGIFISAGVRNAIGGSSPGVGNVISGNAGYGIALSVAAETVVTGNRIGVNALGNAALPNFSGIFLYESANNRIGGTAPGEGNVISGNTNHGIWVYTAGSSGNRIEGNSIGVDASGSIPLGNGGRGVTINLAAVGNWIGGVSPGAGNRISFNGTAGVAIGAAPSDLPSGNRVLSNHIDANGGLGIDLGIDGPTTNDPLDADGGPNGLQNFPVLLSASSDPAGTSVEGDLEAAPNRTYRLEFFSTPSCDASGYGEGSSFLTSYDVITDQFGNAGFHVTSPVSTPPGHTITATATDPDGNSSEFSPCLSLGMDFYTLQPCRVADTRSPAGPHGGPALASGQDRTFALAGQCGLPSGVRAVSVNATVTLASSAGHLLFFASGTPAPGVSSVNYSAGQTRAGNAVVTLGPGGGLSVQCVQASGTVDLVLDVTGYFR